MEIKTKALCTTRRRRKWVNVYLGPRWTENLNKCNCMFEMWEFPWENYWAPHCRHAVASYTSVSVSHILSCKHRQLSSLFLCFRDVVPCCIRATVKHYSMCTSYFIHTGCSTEARSFLRAQSKQLSEIPRYCSHFYVYCSISHWEKQESLRYTGQSEIHETAGEDGSDEPLPTSF